LDADDFVVLAEDVFRPETLGFVVVNGFRADMLHHFRPPFSR
jgi:hypothetical protein